MTATGMVKRAAGARMTVDASAAACPRGFTAFGLPCGMRKSGKPDLALFLCEKGASAAGVFTKNLVRAAPVDISEASLREGRGLVRAVMINSACANAATGPEGRRRADETRRELAAAIGAGLDEVLIASTGVIGIQLQSEKMLAAYPALLAGAGPDGLPLAGMAIMTTDTRPKSAQVRVEWEGRSFNVAGVAKGSGMIHPNMATMLGVVMTDAQVAPDDLQDVLRAATNRTFNRISVDGDTSTNDCVFALASGEAGAFPLGVVAEAVERVCRELAMHIVRDGEGARKVVRILVREARSEHEAEQVAKTVAGSLLVRTAIAGGDPNWGRIVAAIGRAGVELDIDAIRVLAGGVPLFEAGAPADSPREELEAAFAGPDVELDVLLARGSASAEYLTCDLTEGYIRINTLYTT